MITNQTQAGWSTSARAAMLCAVGLMMMSGCSKVVEGNQGEPVRDGDAPVQVTVTGAALRRVTLETPDGPKTFPTPVLAVSVKFENVGAAPHFYQPHHTTDKAAMIQEPLLFVDPGEGQRPQVNISSVRLDGGLLPDQQAQGQNIEAGKSLTDVFIFQAPAEESASFVLTIPSALHGGKKTLQIRVPYQKNEVPTDAPTPQGEAVELGTVKVSVTQAEVAWVELSDKSKGKGYSSEPLLKVTYKVEPLGEGGARCTPNHTLGGSKVLAPSLFEGGGGRASYPRVRFGGTRTVKGQADGELEVKSGGATDFALFERPPKGVSSVIFTFPGALCGGEGVARIEVPYTYADPEKPKDLTGP